MEFFGTNFTLTLGSWRLRFAFALEDTDELPHQRSAAKPPHRMRVFPEDEYVR